MLLASTVDLKAPQKMQQPASLDAFVEACQPLALTRDHEAVASLMGELIADDETFAASVPAFGELAPSERGWVLGGEHLCYQSDELTVMVLDTLPGVSQPPHDHSMNAIIGVFEGCEEQRFWGRTPNGVTSTTGRMLEAGDVMVLGERAIHAISSPEGRAARALHVYFGNIYDVERSLFHPETLEEFPYDSDRYDDFCRPVPSD